MNYLDIKKIMLNQIKSGKYKQTEKLPSVRKLSKAFNCSPNTISRAYESLKNDHIIYSVAQSGYYLVENSFTFTDNSKDEYDFSSGNFILSSYQVPDFKNCLYSAVETYKHSSLQKRITDPTNLTSSLIDHLKTFQIYAKRKNTFVNLGITQVLTILTNMNFPNKGTKILVESPSYTYYLNFLKIINADVVTIKRDENGINLKELERIFKSGEIKFFYTIPRCHNPLGTSYNSHTIKEIARLALKYNVFIIEDDYFSDVNYKSSHIPIYYYSDFINCIYLKSYTKIIPYIKIGVSIIPDILLDEFKKGVEANYFYSYFLPSLISQSTLETYLTTNLISKHSDQLKKRLNEKLKILNEFTSKWDQNKVKVIGGKHCFYSYLIFSKEIDASNVKKTLASQNVYVSSGEKYFYNEEDYDNGLRISISEPDIKQLKTGLTIISDLISKL